MYINNILSVITLQIDFNNDVITLGKKKIFFFPYNFEYK